MSADQLSEGETHISEPPAKRQKAKPNPLPLVDSLFSRDGGPSAFDEILRRITDRVETIHERHSILAERYIDQMKESQRKKFKVSELNPFFVNTAKIEKYLTDIEEATGVVEARTKSIIFPTVKPKRQKSPQPENEGTEE